MQNAPIRAAGEAVPAAIVHLTLPRSGIVLTITTLGDGRTVMLGRGREGAVMSTPKLTMQGNVQSLFGELDNRAHKVRVLADVVGESLTNDIERVGEGSDHNRRLPYREGTRVQDLALIVVEEADRLIDELKAARRSTPRSRERRPSQTRP